MCVDGFIGQLRYLREICTNLLNTNEILCDCLGEAKPLNRHETGFLGAGKIALQRYVIASLQRLWCVAAHSTFRFSAYSASLSYSDFAGDHAGAVIITGIAGSGVHAEPEPIIA